MEEAKDDDNEDCDDSAKGDDGNIWVSEPDPKGDGGND